MQRGKSKHRPRDDEKLYGGTYPFIQTGDIKKANLYIREYERTYSNYGLSQSKLWSKGTLCITIAANIAETAILGLNACFPDSVIGWISNDKITNNIFIKYYFDFYKTQLKRLSVGGAQENLNLDKLENVYFNIPTLSEQNDITNLLTKIDELIDTQSKIIRVLESQKKELSKILFNKYCKDSSYYPLEDIVSSESIKDFQIQTKDYLPNGKFEVVDQGKKEIIGYSDNSNKLYTKVPVIVYGDHTTIIKYREIPFIVGGDGVKLLKAKTGFLQKYIYYAVCQFNISSEGYKRHWNMLKNVLIPIPNYETQKIIIDTLDSFTKKIKNEEALLEKYRLQKQFLLNNLFI